MAIPKAFRVNPRNCADLFVTLSISFACLYYAHEGIEAEQALGEKRSLTVLACYAALGVVGLLVSPTIRDRVIPAANAAITIAKRAGRRSTDAKVIVATVEPTDDKGA